MGFDVGARRSRLYVITGGIVWLAAIACAPNIQPDPNQQSGPDGERGRAQAMELDTPIIDNVDYTENDMTDWRFFQIPGPGRIVVTLGCDYTGAGCIGRVRNEVGQVLEVIEPGGEPVANGQLDVRRGNYYVEVYAQAAATEYTIQVDYEPN